MKAKHLGRALEQIAEEGVAQVFRPQDGSPALVGVVGTLQFDVLQARLKDEYGLEVMWDSAEFTLARWIAADDPKILNAFVTANAAAIADDLDGDVVFLGRNQFYLDYARKHAPGVRLTDIKGIYNRPVGGVTVPGGSERAGFLEHLGCRFLDLLQQLGAIARLRAMRLEIAQP